MSGWQQLGLILAISIPAGLGLRFYLRTRHKGQLDRIQRTGRALSWPYYAAGAVLFLAFALGSLDNLPFQIFFSAFAAMQVVMAVRQFICERSQYGIRHLFIAITLAAILSALCRWFGMAMATVLGVGAGNTILLLYGIEWIKQRPVADESADNE